VSLRAAEEARRAATNNGPQVFMNAGGGSSSSSSSSAAGAAANGLQFTKTKSRMVAALLAFFLGGLGAHKFYLGQTGWGILYLLFCWTFIPTLVSLVEGCLYILSTERQFALKYG
jgi:TM2 domain-containing membrane protein YozV